VRTQRLFANDYIIVSCAAESQRTAVPASAQRAALAREGVIAYDAASIVERQATAASAATSAAASSTTTTSTTSLKDADAFGFAGDVALCERSFVRTLSTRTSMFALRGGVASRWLPTQALSYSVHVSVVSFDAVVMSLCCL
jgi:hypothetical protein